MSKLIPALLAAAVVVVAVIVFTGDSDKYIVYVKANDAGGILKNYNVKVGEVAAGKVTDISLDDQDHAVLKVEMDKGAYPIGAGASAAIRPVNLLGEKYIDLNPGDLTKPQPDGVTVPPSRVTVPVELDDALNILDPDTRAGMRILINEAGLAMAGRGADFNETLTQLPPAFDAAKRVVTEVDQENAKLQALITQGDRVLATVSPKSDEFADMIASAADALETAAQRREALGRTVQTAPAALAALRSTLVKLQAASGQISPAADDLTRAAPDLDKTLKRLPQFADDAMGTLAEVRRTSPALSKLGKNSTPTLRALRPTLAKISEFTTNWQPFVDTFDSQGRNGTAALLKFVNGWASTTSQRDGLGHVFRLRPTVDSSAAAGLLQRVGAGALTGPTPQQTTPDPPVRRKAKAAPAKAETPAAKAAEATAPVKKATDAVGKTVKGVTDAVTGALTGILGTREGGGLIGGLTGKKGQTSAPSSGGNDTGKLLNYLLGP